MKVAGSLEERQVEREEAALGTLRLRDALQPAHGGLTSTTPGLRLMQLAIKRMVPAIDDYLAGALLAGGKRNRNIGAAYVLQEFDPAGLAALASMRCLQALAALKPLRVQRVAMDLADQLEGATAHRDLEKADKKLYRRLKKALAKASKASSRAIPSAQVPEEGERSDRQVWPRRAPAGRDSADGSVRREHRMGQCADGGSN